MGHLRWLVLLAFFAIPGWVPAAQSAPLAGITSAFDEAASDVLDVAVKCGRNAYYKKGFRAKNGQWVKGRCISTKKRRR